VDIPTKYKLLKVLDFEDLLMKNIPNNLGNFMHLKYLSILISSDGVKVTKSIGMLQNLETLVLSCPCYFELPK
jgi:disease resistance protein RPM1